MTNAGVRDGRSLVQELDLTGHFHWSDMTPAEVAEVVADLGTVIQETDVIADPSSRQLVTSDRALDVHTDHHRADYIAWHCVEQCEEGGDSLLVDAEAAFERLSRQHQDALEQVFLTEHRVFRDDPGRHPLVGRRHDRRKFYYSFWLIERRLDAQSQAALDAFRAALSVTAVARIRLAPGDLLICDNGRMLHGRTAITKGNRNLKRYWIERRAGPTQRKGGDAMTQYTLPERITGERIEELKQGGVLPDIAEIDLSMVKMKLRDEREGKGWSKEECEAAELEYKRFLTLNVMHPKSIVPTSQIDFMWHYHILDTRAYHKDTEQVFGGYFHHFPYFGMRGDEDEQNLRNAFERTKALYEEAFGEPMLRDGASKCWHDCKGRCWHACSEDDD